ncbi:hypothetical protein Mapa_005005 [Marchantia paleacea]|nr:hypothetical protein Mapa_005005 [Marchantia paleacea]
MQSTISLPSSSPSHGTDGSSSQVTEAFRATTFFVHPLLFHTIQVTVVKKVDPGALQIPFFSRERQIRQSRLLQGRNLTFLSAAIDCTHFRGCCRSEEYSCPMVEKL